MTTAPTPLMKDEIMASAVRALRVAEMPEASQQAMLAGVGENILARVLFEVFAVLPKPKHDEFRALIGSASPLRIYTYLEPYIVDFPAFVQRNVTDEVAETKKLLTQE